MLGSFNKYKILIAVSIKVLKGLISEVGGTRWSVKQGGWSNSKW